MKAIGICLLVGFAAIGLGLIVTAMIQGLKGHAWWVYLVTIIIGLMVIAAMGAILTIIVLFIYEVFNNSAPLLISL